MKKPQMKEETRKKIVNFWYYYKIHVLVVVFILFVASVFIKDIVTKVDYDYSVAFVTEEMIERGKKAVIAGGACVLGVPSKDTVKITDEEGFVESTPKRDRVWNIQTPQVFETALIRHAYFKLMENEENETGITDDAMVVERMENCAVKLVEGSYEYIKITTPEDLIIAESLIIKRN